MYYDLMKLEDRVSLLKEIQSEENKQRKIQSYIQYEIFKDRLHSYVDAYLRGQFSSKTVNQMPIVSSINLCQRIVKAQSSLYRKCPKREFSFLTEEQEQVVESIYMDMMADQKLQKSNEYYKLQNQSLLQVIPKDGKLIMRVYLGHHYDIVNNEDNPEKADCYIISSFDKSQVRTSNSSLLSMPTGNNVTGANPMYQDFINQSIGDKDDYKKDAQRFVVWTDELNFIMDGNGTILSEDVVNPLGEMPFIDVASDKDYEYFVRQGQSVTDFTVQYNGALSDLANIVRMQGWGQAYLIAEQSLIPQNLQIGPNFVLKLPYDSTNGVKPEFGYANASPDLAGSINYIEVLLSNFLSSKGLDTKLISGKAEGSKYSSGIERLLGLIEKFEASQEDMSVYEHSEMKIYDLVKKWHNVLSGTDLLDSKYQSSQIPEESEVSVVYSKPEMIQTEQEQLANIITKLENGLMSKTEAISELRNVNENEAKEILKYIDEEDVILSGQEQVPTEQPLTLGEPPEVDNANNSEEY